MIMNMLYLKSVYGYEIGSYSMDIQKQVLDLQDTNEDLSEFSKQFYGDE